MKPGRSHFYDGSLTAVTVATAGQMLGRAVNTALPFAVLAIYGAGHNTDVFFFLLAVAFFFFGTLSNALADASVPMFATGQIRLTVAGGCRLALIGFAMAGAAGYLLIDATAEGSAVCLAAVAAMAGAGLAAGPAVGALQAGQHFFLPGITWALRLIPVTVFLFWPSGHLSLTWLAVGLAGADMTRTWLIYRAVPLPKKDIPDKTSPINTILGNYSAVVLAMILVGMNPLIDRWVAQRLGAGSLSVMESADRIYAALAGLATIGLFKVLLSRLSRHQATDGAAPNRTRLIMAVFAWSVAWAAIGMAVNTLMIEGLLSATTRLNGHQVQTVVNMLNVYLAGLPGFVIVFTCVYQMIAGQKVWRFPLAMAVGAVLNLAASLWFSRMIGLEGIALATSVINTLLAIWLLSARRKKKLFVDEAHIKA